MKPNEYWGHDTASSDQKFYTAFCMLVAACCDYATGVKLQRQKILNWSCTVMYYSLVHAGRLICFMETGDFPIMHNQLSNLFANGHLGRGQTWISKRLKPYTDRLGMEVEPATDFRLRGLAQQRRCHWGYMLAKARELRDDANYEGLLISNEYNHVKVTDSFGQLSTAVQEACKEMLPDMASLFKSFVDSSPRSAYWYAFLNWRSGHDETWTVSSPSGEGLYYLEASLKYRGVGRRLISEVFSWLGELRCTPDMDVQKAREAHNNIVMSAFGMKSTLMKEFENDVREFRHLIDQNQT